MRLNIFKRIFVILMSFFVLSNSVSAARTGLLKDVGIKIDDNNLVETTLNLDDYDTNIRPVSECSLLDSYDWFQVVPNGNCTLVPNQSYYIYYRNAINYFGISLDLRIDVKRLTPAVDENYLTTSEGYTELIKTDYYNSAMVMDDHRVRLKGAAPVDKRESPMYSEKWVNNAKTQVKYSFYKDGEPFNMYGLIGIIDPDGANYLFDIDRDIYYTDAPLQNENLPGILDEIYEVKDDSDCTGICRNDTETYINGESIPFWVDAIIAIKIKGESSLTITFDFADDLIKTPIFYTTLEKFNIVYDLNDSTEEPATNNSSNPVEYMSGDEKNILNPTREGYEFLGWEEGNKINVWDFGDKTFTARWKRIEHTITTSVKNGTIDPYPSVTINDGDSETIHYTPNEGYILKKIIVDGVEVSIEDFENSYDFTNVKENHEIYVEYRPEQGPEYFITTSVKNGTIDPSIAVYDGETITINYNPDRGYVIKKVEVDGYEVDIQLYPNNYTFSKISNDHVIFVEYDIENPQTGTAAYLLIPSLMISLLVIMYFSNRNLFNLVK